MLTRSASEGGLTLSAALFSFALLFASTATAQQAETAPTPASEIEAPAGPAPIPTGEIVAAGETLDARLAEIDKQLAEEHKLDFASELSERRDAIEEAARGLDEAMDAGSSAVEIDAFEGRWRNLSGSLDELDTRIAEHLSELDSMLTSLREETRWQVTRDAALDGSAPKAALDQIRNSLAKIGETVQDVESDSGGALGFQTRIASARSTLQEGSARLEEARSALGARLLERQVDPIWALGDEIAIEERSHEELRRRGGAEFSALQEYAASHVDLLIAHALLIGVLIWSLVYARISLAQAPAEAFSGPGAQQAARQALSHPVAAAVLLGLNLTPFLHPDRVFVLTLASMSSSLPLWFIVLRGLLPSNLRRILAVAAVIIFAELSRMQMLRMVGPVPTLRGLLLFEFVAAIATVLWLRRVVWSQQVVHEAAEGLWSAIFRGWTSLAVAAMTIGIAADLLGYTQLSGQMALVGIAASFVASAFFALTRVLEAATAAWVGAGRFDRLHMFRLRRRAIIDASRRLLRLVAFAAFAYLLLNATRLYEPVAGALVTAFTTPLGASGLTLGGFLAFGFTIWISWRLARLIAFVLDYEIFPRVTLAAGVPYAVTTFTRYAIVVAGFMVAVSLLGFTLDRLALLVSALGVGIGFGLQQVISNSAAGAILLFERPIRVGDHVQLDDLQGNVQAIGIRASKVRTFDGSDVIVPNADFISARVINWTLSDRKRRIILPVHVAYGSDYQQVLELLRGVAIANDEILEEPEPEMLFRSFGDSWLEFELRAWTESTRGWPAVVSDLGVAVGRALAEAGVEVPLPQRVVELRPGPERDRQPPD